MTKKQDVTETVDFTKKTDIVKNVTDKTDTAINITEKIEVVSEKTDSTAETTVTPQPSGSSVVARDFFQPKSWTLARNCKLENLLCSIFFASADVSLYSYFISSKSRNHLDF